jgi:excinuclease ABC subunit B
MKTAIDETNRRREIQLAYNAENGITPESIKKAIKQGIEEEIEARSVARKAVGRDENEDVTQDYLNELEAEMLAAAENLEFERAAALRDRIMALKSSEGGKSRPSASPQGTSARAKAKAGGKKTSRRPKPQS